jgi:hypothetical protein
LHIRTREKTGVAKGDDATTIRANRAQIDRAVAGGSNMIDRHGRCATVRALPFGFGDHFFNHLFRHQTSPEGATAPEQKPQNLTESHLSIRVEDRTLRKSAAELADEPRLLAALDAAVRGSGRAHDTPTIGTSPGIEWFRRGGSRPLHLIEQQVKHRPGLIGVGIGSAPGRQLGSEPLGGFCLEQGARWHELILSLKSARFEKNGPLEEGYHRTGEIMKAVLLTALMALTIAVASAQESMMPPRPSAELDQLNFLVGEFNSADSFMGMDGKRGTGKSTISAKWAIGKRHLTSAFKGSFPGMGEMEGLAIITWNEMKSAYQLHFFDSSTGMPMVCTGKFDNGALVMTSEEVEVPGMGKSTFRVSYKKLDDKKVEFKLDMKMGEEWMNQMTSVYTPK